MRSAQEEVSVPDMLRYLRKVFGKENEDRFRGGVVRTAASRRAMICLFLAVLELVKLQALGLAQTGRVRRDRPEAAEGIRSGVFHRWNDGRD